MVPLLYGALLAVAVKLRGEEGARALALWKRKCRQAFEAEAGIISAARASNTQAEGG